MLVFFFLPTLEGDYYNRSVCLSVRPSVDDMSENFVGATFRPLFFTFQMLKMRIRLGNIVSCSSYLFFSILNFWPLGTVWAELLTPYTDLFETL